MKHQTAKYVNKALVMDSLEKTYIRLITFTTY